MFSRIFRNAERIENCLELGSNRGMNLMALRILMPGIGIQAVEINKKAADECAEIPNAEVFNGSVFDFPAEEGRYDLAFTKGVLIHIVPDRLGDVYEILYRASRKYILVAEYYNQVPAEVLYRGNSGRLFKRDFAGEMLDRYKDLTLTDYGFVYHRDHNFPEDDITWFLMRKREK